MKRQTKILVAEDDNHIREGLVDALEMEGYNVLGAIDGRETLKLYTQWEPNLLILDVMMPYKSGYDVCREIRRGNPDIPIIMLTAKGEEIDKVLGLELGADDYVTKPFGLRELMARISAVLRRTGHSNSDNEQPQNETSLTFADVKVDFKTMRGYRNGNSFELSKRELDLISFFVKHQGEVLDRYQLLSAIWGEEYHGLSRTLDQHIVQLRKKIESDPKNPDFIKTVYGVGYRFET